MLDNLDDLRADLIANTEALAVFLLGESNRAASKSERRWGSKGSLTLALTGPKRGLWFDHEAGIGGDLLALIRRERGGDWAETIAWARQWSGQDSVSALPRPPPRPKPEATDEANRERLANIADARLIWSEAGPVAGTIGERYLTEIRKIPVPANGWPGMVIRYHKILRSLVFAATLPDGTVQAIQRIRLNQSGQKADDGKPAKLSRGPQDGVVVRLPGDPAGPLQLAEGPETGLSAWSATGHETWITLGQMHRAEPPPGRPVAICADDDRRRPTKAKDGAKGKDANAHKNLTAAMARWRQAGLDVRLVYPWPVRRGDKSDMNDTLKAEGLEAVRTRIEAALSPGDGAAGVQRVPVDTARVKLIEAVNGFTDDARAWIPLSDDAPAEAAPPVHAIRVDVGAGKTKAALEALVKLVNDLRAAGDKRTVALLVPTHALGDEQADRIRALPEAAGLSVAIWRGRKATDPDAPGETMCRDLAAVAEAEKAMTDVQSAVCQKKQPDGTVLTCPFFDDCGYQRQRATRADIILGAHQLLFTEKPAAFGDLAAVVIDESFWQAGVAGTFEFPLDLFETAETEVPGSPLESDHLRLRRKLARDALRGPEAGPVLRDRLLVTGLTAQDCIEAVAVEWRRKIEPKMYPGMTAEARREAVAAARGNRDVARLARFWKSAAALLADGGPEASGWLAMGENDDGARVVMMKGRLDVAKGWRVPTLILDAILKPELARLFFPTMKVTADLAVATPHMRVSQVVDRAYSKAMLIPPESGQATSEEAQRRARNLRDLQRRLILEARGVAPGRMLVVLQKAVKEALIALGPMPDNVDLAHHNAIAGRDEWRDVAKLIVIGRTMPPPHDVTTKAEALTGAAVPLLTGWYDRADAIRETTTGFELGEADRHPDPVCEAIRWTIAEGEIVQIIGRGRGVNRTADTPLDVLVMTDVPLPLPVGEMIPAAALDLTCCDKMMADGGVALNNPAHAHRAYPGMWRTSKAAEKALERERSPTFPYKESFIGECRTPPLRVTYQLAGPGKKQAEAMFDPAVVPDPAAWLGARLGTLARIEIHTPQPDLPVVEPVMTGEMMMAAAIPPEAMPEPLADPPLPEPLMAGMPPAEIYPGAVLEPPPEMLLTVRGWGGAAMAQIEVPAFGPFMAASVLGAGPLGVLLLLDRPDPPPGFYGLQKLPPEHPMDSFQPPTMH